MEIIDFKTGERVVYITESEVNKVVNALMSLYNVTEAEKYLRNAFIFSFLFWTGVRLREFCLTQKKCIDFNELIYYVPQLKKSYWKKDALRMIQRDINNGLEDNELLKKYKISKEILELIKNGKEREALKKLSIPLEKRVRLGLVKYVMIPLDHVPKEHLNIWKLYLETLSEEDFLVDVSPRQIERIVNYWSEEVLGKKYFPHALRHGCAVKLHHEYDLDLLTVQAILRHSHLGHTERYARITMRDIKKKINLLVGRDA